MSRSQRRYRQRVVDGVCTRCGKIPPRLPSKQCQGCLDKIKARDPKLASRNKKALREKRKEAGMCVYCGELAISGKIACEQCHARSLKTSKKYRNKVLNSKLCIRCKVDVSYQSYKICQECRRKELAAKSKAYLEFGMCKTCGRKPIRAPDKTLCQYCYDRLKNNRKIRRQTLRQEVLNHYGAICSCCGESHIEFLTIDHVNNDGAAHKRVVGRDTYLIHRWIKLNNYPPTIRVLCYNCNCVRNSYGYCPHERERSQ